MPYEVRALERRLLSVEEESTELRMPESPIVEGGARGVEEGGRLKVKVCTVDAGWRVEAMISTSRVKESYEKRLLLDCRKAGNAEP